MRVENGIIYIHADEAIEGLVRLELALKSNMLTLLDEKDDTEIPKWLPRIRNEINSSIYVDLNQIREGKVSDFQALGYNIGVIRWGIESLESLLDKLDKKLAGKFEIEGLTKEKDEIFDRAFTKLLYGDYSEEEIRRGLKLIKLYLLKGYFKMPIRDAAAFYRGLSRGLNGITDENRQYSRERVNTRLLLSIWLYWPSVQQFKTRSQLYFWLCFIHGKQVVGEYKRVEKICERYHITFRKAGRPKKSDSEQAA